MWISVSSVRAVVLTLVGGQRSIPESAASLPPTGQLAVMSRGMSTGPATRRRSATSPHEVRPGFITSNATDDDHGDVLPGQR